MCTVSWTSQGGRHHLFFSRDESRERPRAQPPQVIEREGVPALAPIDTEANGTWVFVNVFGLIGGLLNYYHAHNYDAPLPASGQQWISRGLLVKSLIDCRSPENIRQRLDCQDLSPYRPFWLFALQPDPQNRSLQGIRFIWDGHQLDHDDPSATKPLTTSSFDTQTVVATRRSTFASLASTTPETLATYHRQTDVNHGARGVCMSRSDARTVSLSKICLAEDRASFEYAERLPENHPQSGNDPFGPVTRTELPLRHYLKSYSHNV